VWSEHPAVAEYLPHLHPLAARHGSDVGGFVAELSLGVGVDLWDPRADRVALLTLHAAKGLEFPVVFLVGCEDGLLPLRWGDTDEAGVAEERRLFFVGLTRARSRLYLSHAARRLWRGTLREMSLSPFVEQIQRELLERLEREQQRKRKTAGDDRQRQLF
jgi:DNA helicase-2/ATP-dependent DNA helicase PcrA